MDPLLQLLKDNARLQPDRLASMLQLSESEVVARIRQFEADGIILGYRTLINEERLPAEKVRAVIEVKITPERGGGFDRLAERIAKHSEVKSCYLMSGSYDLLVLLEGQNLKELATFVSEKLATIQGVLSTSTHFMLKPYKEQGALIQQDNADGRLAVTP